MKTLKFLPLFLLLPIFVAAQAPDGKKLRVIAEGLQGNEGSLKILLFIYEAAFPHDEKNAYFNVTKELDKDSPEETFNISPGKYAVVAYHDKNGNGQLDLNWWGNPKEPVAYSLLPAGFRGTPFFSQCAFDLKEDGMTVRVNLAPATEDVSKE